MYFVGRICASTCWGPWTIIGECSAPCGNSGVQGRVRVESISPECVGWANNHECAGNNTDVIPCNRYCEAGGTPLSTSCNCPLGYSGTCCEIRKYLYTSTSHNPKHYLWINMTCFDKV